MMILSDKGERRMGKRAAKYVRDCGFTSLDGASLLVADVYETPAGVRRTLSRCYGRPTTRGRGEVAYWEIRGDDIARPDRTDR